MRHVGIHDVYGELYRQLGQEQILSRARYRASNAALMHCVMARALLIRPANAPACRSRSAVRCAVVAGRGSTMVRNALLHAQYGIVKDRRSAQRYAMQLAQVAKKLYWMMEVERSSVPFEID